MTNVRSITPNDPADFTPELGNYKTLQPFRYWCQKVLPLVYDDSLSYYELLCKVVDYLNKTMEDVETLHGDVTNLHTAYEELQSYVNNYFSTLDVQEEINNKLNQMASDGTLSDIIKPLIMSTLPPLVVANVSDMKDITRTYILKSNSHIYQYIGNTWSDTGIVYGGTIGNMLESPGYLPIGYDLNDVPDNTIYILYSLNTGNYLNYPSTEINENSTLITVRSNDGVKLQHLIYSRGNIFTRAYHPNENKWVNWVINSNYMKMLPENTDFNSITDTSVHYLFAMNKYINYPLLFKDMNGIIFNYTYTGINGSTNGAQVVISNNSMAFRLIDNNVWKDWSYNSNFYRTLPKNTNLNNVDINTIYYLGAQVNSNYGNYPSFMGTYVNGLLETYGYGETFTQIMRMTDGTSAIRLSASGVWRDWESQSFFYGTNLEPFNAYSSYYANFGPFKETFFNVVNSVIFSVNNKHYFNKMSEYVDNTYYTLIDDDTSTDEYVDLYYNACKENGVIGNFAVITEHLSETMTPKLKQYEEEGFTMLYHCHSQIRDYSLTTRNQNVLTNFVQGLREFNEAGFINCGAWVIPFGNSNKSIVELAYMYGFDGAFITGNAIPAFPQRSPYSIPRISVGPSTKGGSHKSLDELKQIIDSYDGRNAWFIFTTHANSWDEDGTAKQLFSDLISYIKSKNWNNVNASEGFKLFKNYLNGIF